MTETPVQTLYNCRKNFIIIGLTGVAGSGCSTLAQIMSSRDFLRKVRVPDEISGSEAPLTDNEAAFKYDKQKVQEDATGKDVFHRKYSICYNFAKAYYEPFTIIKFTHVIWLYALLCYKHHRTGSFKEYLRSILYDKYKPSVKNRDKDYKKAVGFNPDSRKRDIDKILNGFSFWNCLEALNIDADVLTKDHITDDQAKRLSKVFFDKRNVFNNFLDFILSNLSVLDYYSLCFLNHRMAVQIRLTGSLEDPYDDVYDNRGNQGFKHQYDLIRLINFLIKGYRKLNNDGSTRIVIDSLRNSIEAWFLKERYSAFYLIAINDDKNRQSHLRKEISLKSRAKDEIVSLITAKVDALSAEEVKPKEFESGIFASPNVEQVIADAEIHINNNIDRYNGELPKNDCAFLKMEEQWMKYSSLMLHPGLITPSAEERCMSLAFTSKFNSSCISRQVGAVITNSNHSVRTIGWNDVAYGQIPCGLRDLREIIGSKRCDNINYCYSNFEYGDNPRNNYDSENFKEKVRSDYREVIKNPNLKGLPLPFCFKDLHNRYKGEKNQVFTRSLHAEENAMLQMVKYGGEPLINGIIYVTASPCELCSKKLYQIGVRKIVYIDPYPGIAREQIINSGYKRPRLKMFEGAYGQTYFKLYQPFMSYKDELDIRYQHKHFYRTQKDLFVKMIEALGLDPKNNYTEEEINEIVSKLKK
jgi:deoxycytidylate deaminase